ncbi:hypothetical protein GCM10009530_10580 [Microbispora corallina]|uniref:Fibronectin type-III domain-containing protein n=1 Tax=Microbispora corallina TaxID=83302 RepID=A0ABQ4FW49_9ACTN|nr:hypothetical protein Mco01_20210 [Microbispora corallina]
MAPASAADGEILSPADGQTIRTPGPVAISAKTDWYQVSMALYVEGPSVSRQKIGSGGANQTISGSFDPGEAPNGTFTVTLYGEITNKTYKTSTFVLSRPPQTPSGVEARLKNASTVVVTWAKGAEPDLRSYEISSRKTGASGSVSADEACSGSTCQASVAVPAKAAGQKVDLAVRAFRSDGQGGVIGSPGAATASVSIPAPKPSATASQKPASEKSQAASKTGDRRLPTTTLPNPLPSVPKGHGNTKLKLPDVNGTGDPAGPEVAPAKSDAPDVSAQSSFAPLGGLSYGIYAAIAVVLLLIGAHLGALVRRRSGSGAGPARPMATTGPIGPSPTAGTTTGASARTKSSATRRPTVILASSKPRAAGDTGPGTGTAAGDRGARDGLPEPADAPAGADDATAVTGPGGTGSETAASGAGGISTGSGQAIGPDDRNGSSPTDGGSTGKLDGPAPADSTGSSGPRLPADILSDDAAEPGAPGRVPASESAAASVPASASTRGSDTAALEAGAAGAAEDGSASFTSVSAASTAPQPRLDDDLMPHRRPGGNDLPRPRLDDGLWDRPRQPQHDVWTEEDDDAVPSGTRDL